ncbi:MAG TPA: metallophosphoesterase [Tepidisphaeraceae bacterium]|jgi:hypothetical protein
MRWIIGDIHGMLRSLDALLGVVLARDAEANFFFVGDYVNRGPDSRGVIERLLRLANARFVRGNHDDIFDLILHGDCYVCHPSASDPLLAFRWFIDQGLDKTLISYGADLAEIQQIVARPTMERLSRMLRRVPQSHRDFIRKLPSVIEQPDCFIAHGMWDADEPTEAPGLIVRLGAQAELRYPLLWGRYSDEELAQPKRWKRRGFFGHTPVVNYVASIVRGENVPLAGPQIVLLDTAAALGAQGRLTAYNADDDSFVQSDPAGKIIDALAP